MLESVSKYIELASGLAAQCVSRPYSQLVVYSDKANWALDNEARELKGIAKNLGFKVASNPPVLLKPSATYYTSMFEMLQDRTFRGEHRTAFDYFHGLPSAGSEFESLFNAFRKNMKRIHTMRVSHSMMEAAVLDVGFDPSRVFRIPIGIRYEWFHRSAEESKNIRKQVRAELGIPESAAVVGSFQKDGDGWGEGMQPKLIKGPDIFLKAVEALKARVPETWVLLTGPARGYVKQGLESLKVPYRHVMLPSYPGVWRYFHALDLYLIASREEGGPKALLEGQSAGVPVISTRVGQCVDLVRHGENGFLVDICDADALAHFGEKVLTDSGLRSKIIENGFETAKANRYEAQAEDWRRLLKGFLS